MMSLDLETRDVGQTIHGSSESYLSDQRSVVGSAASETVLESSPVLLSVFFLFGKELGVEHGCVAQIGIVSSAEDSPCEFGLIDLFNI